MMDSNDPILLVPEDLIREMKVLFDDRQPILVEVSKWQAWCLMAAVQLASRHPQAKDGKTMQIAILAARHLQSAIATTPALARAAEMGWNQGFDT